MSGPLLKIEGLDVSLRRGDVRVLRSVDLSVEAGQVHGLVGESGAGKSMIGKAVLGVLPRALEVKGGRIALDGQDLLALPEREWRRIIGARTAMIERPMPDRRSLPITRIVIARQNRQKKKYVR